LVSGRKDPALRMKGLKSVCFITHDVQGLRTFYQSVLDVTPVGDEDFVTFSTPGADLTLFSTQGLEEMVPGLKSDSGAGGCFLEFEVEDVDQEYERLKALNVQVLKPPTTQLWGLRSVWFCDPDGNKINFFARVDERDLSEKTSHDPLK
jgi:catechol 2,3-dioxygenase-like lactoylglutathione lyase family enzyme